MKLKISSQKSFQNYEGEVVIGFHTLVRLNFQQSLFSSMIIYKSLYPLLKKKLTSPRPESVITCGHKQEYLVGTSHPFIKIIAINSPLLPNAYVGFWQAYSTRYYLPSLESAWKPIRKQLALSSTNSYVTSCLVCRLCKLKVCSQEGSLVIIHVSMQNPF